ncbi:MAG: NAD-dependent succinate-semialdehyde dehydrogenase [Rhodospirillales bacterium]|nr:NAD-dependent succinate-semialdehyde dehydrogenase [Rhodospirillales bacterium]MBO6787171.1 NAD-dependent succinate-semialdehyde dehydrogenase [Rhodospirillales bacterium]
MTSDLSNFDRRFSDLLDDMDLLKSASFIDGTWTAGGAGATFDVTDPADGSFVATVASLSGDESRSAVDAAARAYPDWGTALPQVRAAVLKRWYDLILANKEDLAKIMSVEQGKPLSEARGEIDYAASFVEFYAEEAKRPNIESVTSHLEDAEMEVWREPKGVAALVTPWNFPSAMLTRKASAALAAGCTVVAHPSHETPLSALALAVLAERSGFPPGTFNVVAGEPNTIVSPWIDDPRVRVLSFTGSTRIGKMLYRNAAETLKHVVLELGGHAPFILFDDADFDLAVREAVNAKFATSGQDCLAANRFFVHRAVYDDFCKAFADKVAALTVGRGLDDCDIGPLMNAAGVEKQVEHVEDAKAKGARVLVGGGRHEAGENFFEPTLLADVPDDAEIMSDETFGPVAAVTPFDDEADVLARANATNYGLVAYLHTMDPRRIYKFSRALQFGMVAVNRTKLTGPPIPFGGVKESGLGREGARTGMEEFMDVKYVCRQW